MNQEKKDPSEILTGILVMLGATGLLMLLLGLDQLFTHLVMKNTPSRYGYYLILAAALDLPLIALVWRRKKMLAAAEAFTGQETLQSFGSPGVSIPAQTLTGSMEGIPIVQYFSSKTSQIIGLVISLIFVALGLGLVFQRQISPPQPAKTVFFGWLALGLGGFFFLRGIKSLILPKPVISISDQGLSLKYFGKKLKMIPWNMIKKVELTTFTTSHDTTHPALGLEVDPAFRLPRLMTMLFTPHQPLIIRIDSLNAKPQEIVEQVQGAWQNFAEHKLNS